MHAELPFAFTLDTGGGRSLLIDGIVDVHARSTAARAERPGVLVVDYKSDRLDGGGPGHRVEGSYAIQQLVYALAALRSGAARRRWPTASSSARTSPVTARYREGGASALEAELRELAGGVSEGRFEPTAEPHRRLCADCPGRPALCSWTRSAHWPSRPPRPGSGRDRPRRLVPSAAALPDPCHSAS